MPCKIGQAHKHRKQNRKRLGNTMYPSSASSTTSYSYEMLNENIYSITTFVLTPIFDTSIHIELNSASDAFVGENDASTSGLDKS